MKKLTAIYRTNRNGDLIHSTGEYKSKKEFTDIIRENGFRVIEVFTEDEIKATKEMTTKDVKKMTGWKHEYKRIAYEYIWQVL